MQRKNAAKGLAVAPLWVQPLRWMAVLTVYGYYRLAYRIRGWGSLPRRRGPTLIIANHQHDLESAVIVASLALSSFSWRYPIFTVSSRRMWEPGFFAERIPWLSFALRTVNAGSLFSAIGLQPIENDLHSRPFVSLAYTLYRRHGDLPLHDVFRERAIARLPRHLQTLADVFKPSSFRAGRSMASLSELREPYRSEALAVTREDIELDLAHFEQLQRDGATIFSTPEGSYSGDGKMQRLRGVLTRLAPLAQIYPCGISYDPFVGRRLSMLYRVVPSVSELPLDVQIKRARPVTTSALLSTWLHERQSAFSPGEAASALRAQLAELPRVLFVDPELRRDPDRMTRAALDGLARLGALQRVEGGLFLTEQRKHPQFPRTRDMIEYQHNFHAETLAAAYHSAPLAAARA